MKRPSRSNEVVLLVGCLVIEIAAGTGCRVGREKWTTGGNGHMGPSSGESASTRAPADAGAGDASSGAGTPAGPGAAGSGSADPNRREGTPAASAGADPSSGSGTRPAEDAKLIAARLRMVIEQIESRGVRDPNVLEAMRTVPRHRFVPEAMVAFAYEDGPLPIGEAQTISQPYIVALMTELLRVKPGGRVLEIGTGSGYQAAVLAEMGQEVYTIEIIEPLAVEARRKLELLGYRDIQFRIGDGYRGWPEAAPFDGIIVTAAPDHVPQPLIDQLKIGGRLVIPVGSYNQDLLVITRSAAGTHREESIPVRFVPMTGEAQHKPH